MNFVDARPLTKEVRIILLLYFCWRGLTFRTDSAISNSTNICTGYVKNMATQSLKKELLIHTNTSDLQSQSPMVTHVLDKPHATQNLHENDDN